MCQLGWLFLCVAMYFTVSFAYDWPEQPWVWYQRQQNLHYNRNNNIHRFLPRVNSEVDSPNPSEEGSSSLPLPSPKITREALKKAIDEMRRVTAELGEELQPIGKKSDKLWAQFTRILAKYAHEIKNRVVDYAIDLDRSHEVTSPGASTSKSPSPPASLSSASPSSASAAPSTSPTGSATMTTSSAAATTTSGSTIVVEKASTSDPFASAVPVSVGGVSELPTAQTGAPEDTTPATTTEDTKIVPPVVTITQAFLKTGLVPALVSQPPLSIAEVRYTGGVQLTPGMELKPAQTGLPPTAIKWPLNEGSNTYHTLMLVSPDMQDGTDRLHWLVVNIPGDKIAYGNTLAEYVPAAPAPTTGPGVYVFLIFEQKEPIFDASIGYIPETSLAGRASPQWSASAFALKHSLGGPIAGNLFMSRCDQFSGALLARLGVTGVGVCGSDKPTPVQPLATQQPPANVIDNNLFANAPYPYQLAPMPWVG